MDTLESTNHPFIVRIWLEESAEEVRRATWRGHITHAPTGKRCYLDSLDDIATFIAPYLEGMGVKLSLTWRLRRCLAGIARQGGRGTEGSGSNHEEARGNGRQSDLNTESGQGRRVEAYPRSPET